MGRGEIAFLLLCAGCGASGSPDGGPGPAPDAGSDAALAPDVEAVEVGVDAGPGPADGGASDGGPSDGGLSADSGALTASVAEVLERIPNLVICTPAADPWVHQTEMSPGPTHYQSCAARCSDWTACTVESTVRGRTQVEVAYVVDEDGSGNGFGGTLRFTKEGARDRLVMFHKGGAGTTYVDDDLPARVEAAGGTYAEPKWVAEADTAVGWFSRPFAGSRLEKSLFGVSLRPAAVMKWLYLNVSGGPFATAGCSGGSIATYYPRHWHGLDVVLRYQLLSGGPVMSKIQAGCGGADRGKGRCTLAPTLECQRGAECGAGGGSCSPYQWKRGDLIMKAVRGTIDHLHAAATGGTADCDDGNPQAAFDQSDFDSPTHAFDAFNEHPIDFMANVGVPRADDDLNVLASGAAVYSGLSGRKSWTVQTTGIHCDSFKTEAAWALLRGGAGL